MKNRRTALIFAVFLLIFNLYIPVSGESDNVHQKTILIDPGHGGFDGGAESATGTVEKDLNLKISLKLKAKLQQSGYKVVLTREDDRALCENDKKIKNKKRIDLNNRCNMKQTSNCDLFLSIHMNKFPESKYYGAQVWYSENPNSMKLAHLIQENFKSDLDDTNNRQEKPAKSQFKILRSFDTMPSVIIECGFLSNPKENEKLKSDEYQDKIAESIKKSVNMYFQNI
ncbi:MAG: N-acetylmuramoyl-L-alanine amidase CwlD [Solirubrobacterales bacterium]